MNEDQDNTDYIPQSGRGVIGYAWTGHAAPIGWTREQVQEMPRLCAKLARLDKQKSKQ